MARDATPPLSAVASAQTLRARAAAALTRGLTRNVVALGVVSLLTDVSSEMLVYVIPLFLANVLAAPMQAIGLIEGIAESTASLLKLASGAISDRIGRRRLLVGLGYGGSVVAKALYLVATTWPVVLVARLGDRIGKGIRTAPRDALIADSVAPEARGVAFGLHRAMDTTGAFSGVLIAAIVIWAIEGDATRLTVEAFRTLALLALIPGVLAIVTIAIGVHDVKREPEEGAAATAGTASPVAGVAPAASPSGASLGRLARLADTWHAFPAPFWLYILATGLFTLGNSSDAFLALRSQQLGLTLLEVLLVIVAFNATNAIIAWPAGALSDRVGRRGLVATAWFVYAACYAGFALAPNGSWVLPLWIAYGAYYALSEGVGKALIADVAPRNLRATAYGILNATIGVMILPASVIAGILFSVAAPAPFWFGAACTALAAILLLATVHPAAPADRVR